MGASAGTAAAEETAARGMIAASLPSPGVIVAAVAGALIAVAVLALAMRRYEEAFPLLAILALPFRVPISADGRTVNLLIPLYLVLAAGTLVHLIPRLLDRLVGGPRHGGGHGDRDPDDEHRGWRTESSELSVPSGRWSSWRSPRRLEWLLLGSVVLSALRVAYAIA